MGLEFQSRGFVYLKGGESIETDLNSYPFCTWHTTGSESQFRHFCEDGKGAAYAAARHVQQNDLNQSIGLFSLSADFCDVGPGYDRGYLLLDGFREIDTRNTYDADRISAGLFNHFNVCFHVQLTNSVQKFLDERQPNEYQPIEADAVPIAGWFYNRSPVDGFQSAADYFANPRSIAFANSGGWDDEYLFFGDIADIESTLKSMLSVSTRFKTTLGMMFLISDVALDQIMLFGGNAYSIGQINLDDLEFYDDIQFSTDRHGYVQR